MVQAHHVAAVRVCNLQPRGRRTAKRRWNDAQVASAFCGLRRHEPDARHGCGVFREGGHEDATRAKYTRCSSATIEVDYWQDCETDVKRAHGRLHPVPLITAASATAFLPPRWLRLSCQVAEDCLFSHPRSYTQRGTEQGHRDRVRPFQRLPSNLCRSTSVQPAILLMGKRPWYRSWGR